MTTEIGRRPKFNRKFISLEDKIGILDRLKNGEKLHSVARKLKLNESTLRTIRRNESKIRAVAKLGSSVSLNRVVRIKDKLMPKMENCLMMWIEDCNRKNMPVTKEAIKRKALKIYAYLRSSSADERSGYEFSASKGWYERFRNRFPLHDLITRREQGTGGVETARKFSEKLLKTIEDGGYTADQVFNVAETGFYWKRLPCRTCISKNERAASEFEAAKDRITLLLCSNASGDCVTKPMLINRSSNSAEMERLDEFRLPVHWRENEKDRTTGGVFRDWFFNCFVPEVENYTDRKNIDFKILLIIDDATGYPKNVSHPNVKLIFLPPDTGPIIQPLNQGVIKTLKLYYIRRTLEFILDRMQRSETSAQLLEEFSILDSVEILGSCVKDLQPSTLNVSWKRIWPGVVTMEDHLTLMATEIVLILNVARALGGHLRPFVDTNEKDIYELIDDDKELNEEKLVQLADESVSNITGNDGDEKLVRLADESASNVTSNDGDQSSEETFDESEKNITSKSLNVGFELARMLETHFTENDPSRERSAEFKRRLRECLAPYLEIQKELETKEQFLIPEITMDTATWEDARSGDENIVFKDELMSHLENSETGSEKRKQLKGPRGGIGPEPPQSSDSDEYTASHGHQQQVGHGHGQGQVEACSVPKVHVSGPPNNDESSSVINGSAGSIGARSAPSTPLQVVPGGQQAGQQSISGSQLTVAGANTSQPPRSPSHTVLRCNDSQLSKPLSRSTPSMAAGGVIQTSGKVSRSSSTSSPTTTSSARQKKFHRHFSQVAADERVLNYYSCALVGDILLQGHLYITPNYFAFYSNVFGYVTKLLIPTVSVLKISKEKTARIIPNAVAIATEEDRHVFCSLLSRDSTFKLMKQVWDAAMEPEPSPTILPLVVEQKHLVPDTLVVDDSEVNPEEDDSSMSESGTDLNSRPPAVCSETDGISTSPITRPSLPPPAKVEPLPVPLLPATSSRPNVMLSLFPGALRTSTVIAILIGLLAALYVSAALMMFRIDKLHTAYLNHPLVSPERFTQDRLLHYLNTNLDQIIKVRQSLQTLSQQLVTMSQSSETDPAVSGGVMEPEDAPS